MIERKMIALLDGKGGLTKESRDELRADISAATKFLAVTLKSGDKDWGSGFTNGADKGDKDDAGLDDDGSA